MEHWAQSIGPYTARLFERILADKPHPEMGYRSCLGIIRLAGQYSVARMEAAAERALVTGACRYQSVKSILKNSLDAVPPPLVQESARAWSRRMNRNKVKINWTFDRRTARRRFGYNRKFSRGQI